MNDTRLIRNPDTMYLSKVFCHTLRRVKLEKFLIELLLRRFELLINNKIIRPSKPEHMQKI